MRYHEQRFCIKRLGFPALPAAFAFCALYFFACGRRPHDIDVSMYDYRDTRELVRLVSSAAQAVEAHGLDVLVQGRHQTRSSSDNYVYVYDMNNTCLFHAGMPDFVGKNLSEVKDVKGRLIAKLISHALETPGNPHSWVHYKWWEPGTFYPVPKSSCHFKAKLPDGTEVYVGGGMDYPHEEKEFIRIVVDSAVALVNVEGIVKGIDKISDPYSHFNFRDVRVFIFRPDGIPVLSPVLGEIILGSNLLACTDSTGNYPFARAVETLLKEPVAWQIFMTRSRTERQLVKKILYLRKTEVGGETFLVGAITDLPQTP